MGYKLSMMDKGDFIERAHKLTKLLDDIRVIFDGYKYHSIKGEGDKVVVRFNDMQTFHMGVLLLETENIEHDTDEQGANINVRL